MRQHWPPFILFCISLLLAVPVAGYSAVNGPQDAVHWHNDLESAKVVAKESGRLVLVHFWAPSCGPCMALEQNVFNQPGVAGAIETQFVPVKLNADENSATAQWFGINRIPCDVIVTPDGQMVAKLISPPTPAAYVAEMTSAAGKYAAKGGQMYAKAANNAPSQPQLNSAYANLQVSPNAQLAIAPALQQPAAATTPSSVSAAAPQVVQNPLVHAKHHKAADSATSTASAASLAANPQAVSNPATGGTATNSQAALPAIPVTAAVPNQVNNPYMASTTSAPAAQTAPVSPLISPAQTTPVISASSTPPFGAPAGLAVSPTTPAAPLVPVTTAPDPSRLPAGAPPLGFDGYCPVSMRNSWKWVPGDPRWGVVHRGRTYWFAGAEEQKQFWTDPDRYTPALSGMDPVLAIDHQQQVPGKREHSLDYDGLFYMFASEATLQQFTANPQRYSAGVRQAMGIPRGRLVR
jgi:protein disulfide-isomerase